MAAKRSLPSVPVSHPECVTAAARRLLIRRVFDLLGAARGALWWQTSHPDFGDCAPLLKMYPEYDWVLHDSIFKATSTSLIFRTVGLVFSSAAGAKEDDTKEGSAPAPGTVAIHPQAPVWQCHDVDGSSSWWLALMYAQGLLDPPYVQRYEEHYTGCPMCIYHVEIARLTTRMFPEASHEAKDFRQAVGMTQKRF